MAPSPMQGGSSGSAPYSGPAGGGPQSGGAPIIKKKKKNGLAKATGTGVTSGGSPMGGGPLTTATPKVTTPATTGGPGAAGPPSVTKDPTFAGGISDTLGNIIPAGGLRREDPKPSLPTTPGGTDMTVPQVPPIGGPGAAGGTAPDMTTQVPPTGGPGGGGDTVSSSAAPRGGHEAGGPGTGTTVDTGGKTEAYQTILEKKEESKSISDSEITVNNDGSVQFPVDPSGTGERDSEEVGAVTASGGNLTKNQLLAEGKTIPNMEGSGFTDQEWASTTGQIGKYMRGEIDDKDINTEDFFKLVEVQEATGRTIFVDPDTGYSSYIQADVPNGVAQAEMKSVWQLSAGSTALIDQYNNAVQFRTSEKFQTERGLLDELSVKGIVETDDGTKKSMAYRQMDRDTTATLSKIFGYGMDQESFNSKMAEYENMSDEEKEEFQTVELRNLNAALDQFDQEIEIENEKLRLATQELAAGAGYVLEYTTETDPVTGKPVTTSSYAMEEVPDPDNEGQTISRRVRSPEGQRLDREILESKARVQSATDSAQIARDEINLRAFSTDEENLQRMEDRISREYMTEITLKSESQTAKELKAVDVQASLALQEMDEIHEREMFDLNQTLDRERILSNDRQAALTAAIELQRQQSQESIAALTASVGMLQNIMNNPYGYFAMQQLGGLEGIMGGQAQAGTAVPGLEGLQALGYQQPAGAGAGQAVRPSAFFGGAMPTIGALQGVSPETQGLLQSLLGFTGTTPEEFQRQAASVTPAAERLYNMPTFAQRAAPDWRGRGPSSRGIGRTGGSYAGTTGALNLPESTYPSRGG